jgi:Ca2+/Na+ antiporter
MTQDIPIELNMEINLSTMMNKSIITDFAKVFIVLDFCLIIYSLFFQDSIWLLNTQVAFLGSLFVTLASFFSYKKNIQNRIDNLEFSNELVNKDKIDEIEDPYDLYSEDEVTDERELTPQKIKEIIKEEKTKVKRNTVKNTFQFAGTFVSIYRILGYGFLLLGFFALNNNKLFLVIPFLIGLAIVPIGTLLSKLVLRPTSISEEDQ